MGSSWKQDLVAAAHAILSHVESVAGSQTAEDLVKQLVQATADGLVEGIEIASSALPAGGLIVSAEKLALPWGEKKVVSALDEVIDNTFTKLRAKYAPVAVSPENVAKVEAMSTAEKVEFVKANQPA